MPPEMCLLPELCPAAQGEILLASFYSIGMVPICKHLTIFLAAWSFNFGFDCVKLLLSFFVVVSFNFYITSLDSKVRLDLKGSLSIIRKPIFVDPAGYIKMRQYPGFFRGQCPTAMASFPWLEHLTYSCPGCRTQCWCLRISVNISPLINDIMWIFIGTSTSKTRLISGHETKLPSLSESPSTQVHFSLLIFSTMHLETFKISWPT